MAAPQRGVVLPTLAYRALSSSWPPANSFSPATAPAAVAASWLWPFLSTLRSAINVGRAPHGPALTVDLDSAAATQSQNSWTRHEDAVVGGEEEEEETWDRSMAEDEVLRG